jgi:hypothetical protein
MQNALNMSYIKSILAFMVVSLTTAFAQPENSFLSKSPLYLREFLLKLEIPANSLADDLPHIAIRKALELSDMQKLKNTAERAKDDYSGAPYFFILDDSKKTMVGHRYVLEHGYITVEIFLYKNESGLYERASFVSSTMRVAE